MSGRIQVAEGEKCPAGLLTPLISRCVARVNGQMWNRSSACVKAAFPSKLSLLSDVHAEPQTHVNDFSRNFKNDFPKWTFKGES